MTISLIVLLAIAGIFIYKASAAKDSAPNAAAADGTAFAVAKPAINAVPTAAPEASAVATPEVAAGGKKVGEYLASLGSLNEVAKDQDAVFVFIPAPKNGLADEKTNTALLEAQRNLKTAQFTLGLYTLPATSPDYARVSAQVQTPAILVACKGKGMAAVSGEITETKLLQAFMASSRAGGCGPSGCGPSGPACN